VTGDGLIDVFLGERRAAGAGVTRADRAGLGPALAGLFPIGPIGVHLNCYQRSLVLGQAPAELLRLIPGVNAHEVEALCCGMVGSFGFKAGLSPLSRTSVARLFSRIREHDGDVVTSRMSCRSQIEEGTGQTVAHPVEVLAAALPGVPPATR